MTSSTGPRHISPDKRWARSLCFYFFVHILRCSAGDKNNVHTKSRSQPLIRRFTPIGGCMISMASKSAIFLSIQCLSTPESCFYNSLLNPLVRVHSSIERLRVAHLLHSDIASRLITQQNKSIEWTFFNDRLGGFGARLAGSCQLQSDLATAAQSEAAALAPLDSVGLTCGLRFRSVTNYLSVCVLRSHVEGL